jgi:tRNA pseudouridine38-40 synthase
LAQVASFATASSIPAENWRSALNDILPASIRVLEVTEAAPDFHARKSVRAKTYRYRIHRAAICPPFLARYVWHHPYPLEEVGDGYGGWGGRRQARFHVVCGGRSGAGGADGGH